MKMRCCRDNTKILIVILLSGLLIRIAAFFLTDRVYSDFVDYHLSAAYFYKGQISEAIAVRSFYPMLYPLVLSLAFYVGTTPLTMGLMISVVLGTFVIYFTYLIAKALFENGKIALLSSAFVAVSPPLVDAGSSALRDTPGLFLEFLPYGL